MNKQRRKDLGALCDRVIALAQKMAEAGIVEEFQALCEALEALRDEEQDYADNMPEALQSSDKHDAAEQAVSSMQDALDALEPIKDALDEFSEEDIVSKIDDARGME